MKDHSFILEEWETKGKYMNFKIRKKAYLLMAVFILAASLFLPMDASASPVILGLSTNDIRVGDTFTVSVAGAQSSNLSLHYDGTMVSLKGQNGATLDGNTLTIAAKSASFTFEAKQEGSAGFVASSDMYDRSSAVVSIAAAATDTNSDAAATESTDADTSEDTTDEEASAKTDSTDTETVSDSTEDTSAVSDDTDSADSVDTEKHGISSSDLSFRQLILDRRMILVIAVLLAIIIVLIIRITTLHYSLDDEYESDDIDFDDNEKKLAEKEKEEEQNKLVEHITEDKPDRKSSEIDLDEIDEEKLTMPKAPKKPNEKLKLEDLNNL